MFSHTDPLAAHIDLLATSRGKRFGTILADPPWQFQNRTGKVAPVPINVVWGRNPFLDNVIQAAKL